MAAVVTDLRSIFDAVQHPSGDAPSAELVEQIRELNSIMSLAQAAQTMQLARFATRSLVRNEHDQWIEAELPLGHVDEFAADTLAPELGLTPGQAQYRVSTAAKLAAHLPQTLQSVASGQVDLQRARVVVEELLLADRFTCRQVEDLVLPAIERGSSSRTIRHQVRATLAEVDADALAQRVKTARSRRFVRVAPAGEPGVSEWWVQLSSEQSAQCWAAVDELAHQRKTSDPGVAIDQARADAFVDLLLSRASVKTTLKIAVPVEAFARSPKPNPGRSGEHDPLQDSLGVEIPGVGVIPARHVQTLVSTFGTTLTRMLVDAQTGTVLETGVVSYRPSAAIARQVRARDGTCRFPNCTVRAERCDIDHVVPWPDGKTKVSNLLCLCRHHHRLKTFTRWRPEIITRGRLAGRVIWTDPFGQEWVTSPIDHTQFTAA